MKVKKLPFNIQLLDPGQATFAGMFPVRSLSMFDNASGDFHPQGLYSNIVFGKQGDQARDLKASFIELKTEVFHPFYMKELAALKSLYREILTGKGYAIWDEEDKDFVRSNILEGETGFAFFMSHFPNLEFKTGKSTKRQLRIELLEKYRPKCMVSKFIVIPAGIRDVEINEEGRPVEDDINPLYRKIIAAANTINPNLANKNTDLLDGARQSIQTSVELIYDYIFNMVEGKKGFLQAKYGSRRVFGSTRNILSSMETGATTLGDARQPGLNTTVVGLHQFVKACEPLFVASLRNGFCSEFFENINGDVTLVDRKTLRPISVNLPTKLKDKWGTSDGLSGIINTFKETPVRHRPVTIDGHYLKLIYQDDKFYKVFDDINEVPEKYDKSKVRPMTWTELYYLHAKDLVERTRGFVTRYPITGLGSIYATEVYMKTTVTGYVLQELGNGWEPNGNEALEFPGTTEKLAFFGSMAVHPGNLSLLGADFD